MKNENIQIAFHTVFSDLKHRIPVIFEITGMQQRNDNYSHITTIFVSVQCAPSMS